MAPSSPAVPVWHVALLAAGVMLNLALLETVSRDYFLMANPVRLLASLGVCALFFCFAVVLLPAKLASQRGISLGQAVEECVGVRAAWVFQKLVVTVWATGWFASLCWFAVFGIRRALTILGWPRGEEDWATRVGIGLFWLLMIAPSARFSPAELARWSVWMTKVSFCAIFGLLLSAVHALPSVVDRLADATIELHYFLGLEPVLLLWTVPALWLCVPLMTDHLTSRRGRLILLGAGIALPLFFAILAALLTTAGGTALGTIHMKYPSYLSYVLARPEKLGWAKMLVMIFTLLTASRLAAQVCAGALPGPRNWRKALAVTALLVLGSFALWQFAWGYNVWQVAAIPFAPLAGVLGGAYASGGVPRAQAGSLAAWLAGCLVTGLPALIAESPNFLGIWPEWVVFGWLISFAGTYVARLVRP